MQYIILVYRISNIEYRTDRFDFRSSILHFSILVRYLMFINYYRSVNHYIVHIGIEPNELDCRVDIRQPSRRLKNITNRHLDLRVGVGSLEQKVLRLKVAVADVVLVVAVLDPAQDGSNNHLRFTRWDWMGWDAMGWDAMGWDAMGWDAMRWDGMGWDRMGWYGIGWDGMRCDGMVWNGMVWKMWDGMEWDGTGWDGTACERNGMDGNERDMVTIEADSGTRGEKKIVSQTPYATPATPLAFFSLLCPFSDSVCLLDDAPPPSPSPPNYPLPPPHNKHTRVPHSKTLPTLASFSL